MTAEHLYDLKKYLKIPDFLYSFNIFQNHKTNLFILSKKINFDPSCLQEDYNY